MIVLITLCGARRRNPQGSSVTANLPGMAPPPPRGSQNGGSIWANQSGTWPVQPRQTWPQPSI